MPINQSSIEETNLFGWIPVLKLKELEIENQNLKIKVEALKNSSREDKPVQVTNVDILKRLSKLEIAVFGPGGKNNDIF